MTLSSSRQKNAVSEGMALGLVLCEVWDLPYNKVTLELAFRALWREWDYSKVFPSVTSSMDKGLDEIHVLTHASETRQTITLFWDKTGLLSVYPRTKGWDPSSSDNAAFAAKMISRDVPAKAWKDFMQNLLDQIGFKPED